MSVVRVEYASDYPDETYHLYLDATYLGRYEQAVVTPLANALTIAVESLERRLQLAEEALDRICSGEAAVSLDPAAFLRAIARAALAEMRQSSASTAIQKRLVYNKATKRIDVVRRDGLVVDSFDPPQECP